ncbi:MAG: hypothetical protein ACI81V_000188 [Lentimonas sp.]|jgi:hypothetical protein
MAAIETAHLSCLATALKVRQANCHAPQVSKSFEADSILSVLLSVVWVFGALLLAVMTSQSSV